MMPEPSSRLLKALRRKFKTPQEAFRRLGLDAKQLGFDQDEFDEPRLREMVANLSPEACAELYKMLEEKMDGMAPLEDDDPDATDEPPPFNGRPRPGGGMDPITQDASFGAARIGQAMGTGTTWRERAAMDKRLAKDARPSSRKVPSGYDMFAGARRIGQAL